MTTPNTPHLLSATLDPMRRLASFLRARPKLINALRPTVHVSALCDKYTVISSCDCNGLNALIALRAARMSGLQRRLSVLLALKKVGGDYKSRIRDVQLRVTRLEALDHIILADIRGRDDGHLLMHRGLWIGPIWQIGYFDRTGFFDRHARVSHLGNGWYLPGIDLDDDAIREVFQLTYLLDDDSKFPYTLITTRAS